MNQLCKVCGEPAAGFHFGAFTCEGCKSFFGRTYNNIAAIAGCKNNGECVINKKNRTACKACRLRKCLLVGMSKSGSRYGRRSNWFKIHCLLQEQQTNLSGQAGGGSGASGGSGVMDSSGANSRNTHNLEQLARLHQIHARQTYQDKTNPCIKSAINMTAAAVAAAAITIQGNSTPASSTSGNLTSFLGPANKYFNGRSNKTENSMSASSSEILKTRLSDTPSDSGASSAGDPTDEGTSNTTLRQQPILITAPAAERHCNSAHQTMQFSNINGEGDEGGGSCGGGGGGGIGVGYKQSNEQERKHQQFLQIFRSHSEPLSSPFIPFNFSLAPPQRLADTLPALSYTHTTLLSHKSDEYQQNEPIDLSLKNTHSPEREQNLMKAKENLTITDVTPVSKPAPLDLTLVRAPSALSG